MYEHRDGFYRRLGADIQKSIRIDKETYEIINSYRGRNFSDKVRNIIRDFKKLEESVIRSESNTNVPERR